uniref:Centrosomin N-terminal motif 1 domain-containing protein n=1 Tax=Kryptolebias marmoratus TaxID=37003 RepID=A0A3Q3ACU7_KRYMA
MMSNSGFRGYRTISQHLNDLKKENFSLKLRIYFLEEKIQQKFEESSNEVHRRVSFYAADAFVDLSVP